MAMIAFEEVSKAQGSAGGRPPLLDRVSFAIDPGEFVLLTGPSGAGKTTLLHLIAALARPDAGRVYVAGRCVHRLTNASLPYLRRNLGIVFQDLRLLASGGVEENIRMAVEAQGVRRGEARARARVYLELLGLGELRREKIFRLSSDVAQRVAIARAMAAQPAILLADEPTSALDTRYTHLVLDLLARLAERGTTVLMVSRNPLVAGYARVGRVMHLADGRLDPEKTRTVIHEYSADALPRIDAALWTGSAAGGPA